MSACTISFLAMLVATCLAFPKTSTLAGIMRSSSPEPTALETLLLEFVNRSCVDPAADGLRIAPPDVEKGSDIPASVDLAMFRHEMIKIKPTHPLVFNLELLEAARRHSHYQDIHGQGHKEESGQPGFFGEDTG